MANALKVGLLAVLLATLLFSSAVHGAYAQNSTTNTQTAPNQSSSQSGPVPAPLIISQPQTGSGTGFGITVISGDFNSNWIASQGNGSQYNQGGLYSNVQYDIGNSQMCFETQLTNSGQENIGSESSEPYAVFINCSGTIIPINFYNCSSLDESVTPITYVGNLPTFNNTFTYHDISLDTYGQGSSTVTVSLTQQFTANWTEMTVKMGADFDFSNMQLYSPITQQPISPGTPFSLNLVYYVDMSNFTAQQEVGHPVNFTPTVTPTEIYYTSGNGFSYNYTLANMNFGDSYTQIQGNNEISNQTAQAYFQQQGNPGSCFVWCYQTFNGLTYGLTTGLNSDPTLKVPHNPIQVINWQMIIEIVAVAAVAAGLIVTIVKRRRRSAS